jgi:hypothetical protein
MANKAVKVTVFGAGPELHMPATPFHVVVHKAPPFHVESESGDADKKPPFFVGALHWKQALTIEPDSLELTAGSRLTIMMDPNDIGDLARLNRLVAHPRLRDVDIDVHVEKKTSG